MPLLLRDNNEEVFVELPNEKQKVYEDKIARLQSEADEFKAIADALQSEN